MNTILIFTDLEEAATIAAHYTVNHFGALNRYVLFHNVDNLMIGTSPDVHFTMEQHLEKVKNKLKTLKSELQEGFTSDELKIEYAIDVGIASSNVRNIIKKEQAILSVLGMSENKTEFRLLRSDYSSLIQNNDCPLLIIPNIEQNARVHHFLWLNDHTEKGGTEKVLSHLDHTFALEGKAVRCLHLSEELEVALHQKKLESGTRFLMDEFGSTFENDFSAVQAYAAGIDADLLVMPSEQGDWLENLLGNDTNRRLINNARIPIYILPKHLKQSA